MDSGEFLALNQFPPGWRDDGMVPAELWRIMRDDYETNGPDGDGEHVRNGAFHWWLKQPVNAARLVQLVQLTFADPDELMAADVRRYIRRHPAFDAVVDTALAAGASRKSRRADAVLAASGPP